METLNPRQKEVLTCLIEAYIATTLPVGSRTLAERYDFDLSPASLRHEMGALEELGYLTHPHPSAGRVPTDKGYRFYVQERVREEPVSEALANFITREIKKVENLEGLMERASRVLSAMAQEAVLVTFPHLSELYLRELSLVPFDATRILAVWFSTSGLIQNCLVEMEKPISLEEVEHIRRFINEEFCGVPIDSLEEALLRKIQSRRDSLRKVYERTLQIIQKSLPHWQAPRVFVEGSRYILNQPEFQDVEKFRRLVTTLEERSSLIDWMKLSMDQPRVHVAIGKELSKDIWDCALVSRPYFWHGKGVGAVGILGPRRMPYGRIMGLAHQMAEEIGQALERWGL